MKKLKTKGDSRPSTLKGRDSSAPRSPGARFVPQPGAVRLLACFALFLMTAGARWWMIGRYGSDVPWLDQWFAEADRIFKPYHDGTLTAGTWFEPHNEHRILFARILFFGLRLVNGQWDPRLEMAVNAVLYVIVACGLFLILSRDRSPRFTMFLAAVLAVIFALPYGATNTLLGFQSSFYFLAGFSFITMYTLLNSPPGALSWFGGLLCGGAALFSMGSGFTAPLVVLTILLVLAVRSRAGWQTLLRERWITIAAAFALIAAGYSLRFSPEYHDRLRAQSPLEFAEFLLACLSWPGKPMILLAVITWLPFTVYTADFVSGKAKDGPRERFVLAMGFWVLLQAAALALYRGHSEEGLESRYQDILAFGLIANVMCAAWMINASKRGRFMLILSLVWLVVNGIGLSGAGFDGTLPRRKQVMELRRAQTAGFVATEDPRFLNGPWSAYHNPERLGSLLLDPAINPILPLGIRKSLRLAPSPGSPEPSFLNALSFPDDRGMKPELWNWTGIYSRFAVIRAPSHVEYQVIKKAGLPYLFLYFTGNTENLRVMDSKRAEHSIRLLAGDEDNIWHYAFVSCPTQNCTIEGNAGKSDIILMEPKEIGFLSIGALIVSQWGADLFFLGMIIFLLLLAAVVAGERVRTAHDA